jgi:glycerol-3-phosphate acyltransferase PlsY
MAVIIILTVIIPYLICGINTAIVVTKIRTGKDIRTLGSGNAGLTNTYRTQGKFAAGLVLAGDMLKGVSAVLLVQLSVFIILGVNPAMSGSGLKWLLYMAGVFGVFGHIFPVYYGFKGGKGVLVTAASLYAINWKSATLMILIFAVIVAVTRYVSLGSIIAGSLYPFCVLATSIISRDKLPFANFAFALVIGVTLVLMHKENIVRLKNGTENKIGKPKQ